MSKEKTSGCFWFSAKTRAARYVESSFSQRNWGRREDVRLLDKTCWKEQEHTTNALAYVSRLCNPFRTAEALHL